MDSDNPWGASPHLDPTPPQQDPVQRVSFEADADGETPVWESEPPAGPAVEGGREEGGAADAVEATAGSEDGEAEAVVHSTASEKVAEAIHDAPAPAAPSSTVDAPSRPPTPPHARTASPEPVSPVSPPLATTPAAFPASFSDPTPNEGPPMDDFDEPAPVPSPAVDVENAFDASATAEDKFDDFGEVGEPGDDDEFGDFGDFGEGAPLDEAAFAAPPAAVAPPSVRSMAYPPLRLDLSSTARRAVAPQLRDFFAEAWPASVQAVNNEPERQVEGPAQVLITESSRNLLSTLSTLPALRPLDWRRSRIRREHLVSMGVPVNLDEASVPKVSTLSLSASLHAPARPFSAPPIAGSPHPFSSSPSGSRSATPYGTLRAAASRSHTAVLPAFDRARAEELVALAEEDLTLLSLERLRAISDELERISVEASGVLTHALMMREKEGQDKEVYNGMIQDLVVAAAKMKTSSPSAGQAPKRQGSGRWKLSSSVK